MEEVDTWREIKYFRENITKRKRRLGEIHDFVDKILRKGPDDPAVVPWPGNLHDGSKPRTTTLEVSVEEAVMVTLSDPGLMLPLEVAHIQQAVTETCSKDAPPGLGQVEDALDKLAAQGFVRLSCDDENKCVDYADVDKISALASHEVPPSEKPRKEWPKWKRVRLDNPKTVTEAIEVLLRAESHNERSNKQLSTDIMDLLTQPTAKERLLVDKFKSRGGTQVQQFCTHGTREDCMKVTGKPQACPRLHFRKIIKPHTDESLGDCSFLNTCFHMDTCKYIHYDIEYPARKKRDLQPKALPYPTLAPQWVQCDLRSFDMSVLGKFSVVMADPPWDIHMELPYGTMSDDEMKKLNVPVLQDDGFLFLWVTGRAMELGRECLRYWGYKRVDEIIWVKTNQLQRIIRTGRTGHWFNHGKEHCLVGMKGNPAGVNAGLDCDVLVAEVRATSHKPDEVYGLIERLTPGTRKIELFGRPHNCQANWITLGNQLDGVRLTEPDVIERFQKRYPSGDCRKPPEPKPQPSNNTIILTGQT